MTATSPRARHNSGSTRHHEEVIRETKETRETKKWRTGRVEEVLKVVVGYFLSYHLCNDTWTRNMNSSVDGP